MKYRHGLLWSGCLLLLLTVLGQSTVAETCIICGKEVADSTITVEYRGKTYALHSIEEKAIWDKALQAGTLDSIVAKTEPRGALFQGDTYFLNPERDTEDFFSRFGMAIGIWILVAVVSGGIGAAFAVKTHRTPIIAFVIAVLLPVVGVALAFLLPQGQPQFEMRGHKIPKTHAGILCPRCGRSNHPSATSCLSCGAEIRPSAESEVTKARVR